MLFRRFSSIFMLLIVVFSCFVSAKAESVFVEVPVYCEGAVSKVGLFGMDDSVLEIKELAVDDVVDFLVSFTEPGDYYYKLKVIPGDNDKVDYDETIYLVHVFGYVGSDGQLNGIVASDTEGAIGLPGKPACFKFVNAYQHVPTPVPTEEPTPVPTEEPTPVPTEEPTPVPTEEPTPVPTEEPTPVPTEEPTPVPTEEPTPVPTEEPTPVPTEMPTSSPTVTPTPIVTATPTVVPTLVPTMKPTVSPEPAPTINTARTTDVETGDMDFVPLFAGVGLGIVVLLLFVLYAMKRRDCR